ncbi:hypothetical protein [Sphingobacterium haloxyli]|uniref:Uncharacterized protein n=1 Tax=Sphingobacterium haloxyli TaxID=2100533 RepID=A0A2S9J3G2_9SPHI|nr:hypothetical protein [Sphingobacterium haloxyli]PRD47299.1 hypothetical protein C5745_10765 [Sphingobacterium haloxyli]
MENFLPALLIIGAVIYKIYSEYQKEQEKARRRLPKVPPPTPPVISDAEQKMHRRVTESTNPAAIPIPAKKTERSLDIPEVVRKTREERSAEAKLLKKIPSKVVPEIEEKDEVLSFNLREAIIQSAILNRPYQ